MQRIVKNEPLFYSDMLQRHKPQSWDDLDSKTRSDMRCYILQKEQFSVMYNQFTVDEFVEHLGKFESFIKAIYADLADSDNE